MKQRWFYLLPFTFCLCLMGCSIPNFEPPECTQSREAVRIFYSIHFGNLMKPSAEYLETRKPFITSNLQFFISKQLASKNDFFTLTDDYPKAFRIGGCKVIEENKTNVEILLFWKSDNRSEQKSIHAETVKEDGKWLINKVEN